MNSKQYYWKLRATGTPDEFDRWFDGFCFCILAKEDCKFCSLYLPKRRAFKDSRCGKRELFKGRNPFCMSFRTCDECGISCEKMPDFEWIQAMVDKCEEVGLFEEATNE